MRILLLVNNLSMGGAEIQTVRLAVALAERGNAVAIAYFSAANRFTTQLEDAGVTYQRITPRPSFRKPWTFQAAARRVASLCDNFQPDVLHSNLELADVVGQMVSRRLGYPHVITFHNVHWWGWSHPLAWGRTAYRKWWLSRGRPALVGVSNDVAHTVARELGLDETAVSVIYNGIDLAAYGVSAWIRDPNYIPSTWTIICVGRLAQVKGQDLLLRALAMPVLRAHDVRLVLVGGGSTEGELKELAKSLDIEERVTFLGLRQDVPELLSSADLYVQPSRSEGLCIALLEAMATGLPVVATDMPAIREALGADGAGHLVTPESPDHLATVIADLMKAPDECRRQAARSKQRASAFGIASTRDAYLRVYESAMGKVLDMTPL